MMSGSPPTERKARTGLLTPPTRTFSAFSKISFERRRSGMERLCVALMCAPWRSGFQPASHVLGVVGEDDVRTGPLNTRKNFQDHALFVNPAIARRRFHHGVFAADVVRAHGHIEAIPHSAHDKEIR